MNIIEKIWRKIRPNAVRYTALPQGKISSAVKPMATYHYRPQNKAS